MMNESPIILCGSAIDALSRLAFSLSMLSSMQDVNALVQCDQKMMPQSRKITEATAIDHSAKASSRTSTVTDVAKRWKIKEWSHRIMAAYGLAVLVVQLHAEPKS